jgi:hemoglobin
MVSMHARFGIDRQLAYEWADAMRQAISDVAPADTDIANALADALDRMASGMVKA